MHSDIPDTHQSIPRLDPGELSDADFADYLDAVVAAGPSD